MPDSIASAPIPCDQTPAHRSPILAIAAIRIDRSKEGRENFSDVCWCFLTLSTAIRDIYHSHKKLSSWSHSPSESRWLHLGILTKDKNTRNQQPICMSRDKQLPTGPTTEPLNPQPLLTSALMVFTIYSSTPPSALSHFSTPFLAYQGHPRDDQEDQGPAVWNLLWRLLNIPRLCSKPSVSWHFVVPVHGSWLAMIIPNILKGRFITPHKFTNQQGFWTLLNCRKSWNIREPAEFPPPTRGLDECFFSDPQISECIPNITQLSGSFNSPKIRKVYRNHHPVISEDENDGTKRKENTNQIFGYPSGNP